MRASSVALLALIAGALSIDLRVVLRGAPAPISAEEMGKARDAVRELQKPGDLLAVSPLFSVRELQGLGELVVKPDLPNADLRRSRRVIAIDRPSSPMGGLGSAVETRAIGGDLAVRVFPALGGASTMVFDLYSALERAEMRIERPEGTVTSRCKERRGEGGFSCPGEADWLYLAQRNLTVSNQPSNCVWAHPTTGGVIVIELPASPAAPEGKSLLLEVSAALTDEAASGTPDGAAVRTEIRQKGEVRGNVVVPNQVGWFRTKVVVDPDVPIELRVTTARDGRRHHCLNAEITEGKP